MVDQTDSLGLFGAEDSRGVDQLAHQTRSTEARQTRCPAGHKNGVQSHLRLVELGGFFDSSKVTGDRQISATTEGSDRELWR